MISNEKHFSLQTGEYLITPEHPDARRYSIYLDGKKINDVVGLVRINLECLK